mgnify:CR=1 FL=1
MAISLDHGDRGRTDFCPDGDRCDREPQLSSQGSESVVVRNHVASIPHCCLATKSDCGACVLAQKISMTFLCLVILLSYLGSLNRNTDSQKRAATMWGVEIKAFDFPL